MIEVLKINNRVLVIGYDDVINFSVYQGGDIVIYFRDRQNIITSIRYCNHPFSITSYSNTDLKDLIEVHKLKKNE